MTRSTFVGLALLAAACGGKAVVDGPPGSGGAGGNGTAATGTGGEVTSSAFTGATTNTGAPSCADLEAAYATELETARACDPDAGPDMPRCEVFYPADLKQCCTRRAAVHKSWEPLDAINQAYLALGCLKACELECPPEVPVSGSCNAMTRLCDTVPNLPD
ncbi:MAG: hypothetical protein FJ096_01610 [Deltaproteobacteria bacterium]|nr:hypothetical protein [Deltaproteobacteria bacterium]